VARIQFGIVGGGWRAEFYLRIAHSCPERFGVTGMVVRSEEKGSAVEQRWGVRTFRTLDGMLAETAPRFVVTSVPWGVNPELLKDLVARGVPALSETPPAPDLGGLRDLWECVTNAGGCVQVAEQYHLQPMHQARLAVAASGKLGAVSQAQVSVAHGYHGISLMRRFLGITHEQATIRAFDFKSPLVAGPGRDGPPQKEETRQSKQDFVLFDYGDRLGWFDFTGDQYFSWVRKNRLLVRGDRGELTMDGVAYLKDYLTPVELKFTRHVAGADGNLEGLYLKGVQLGDEWLCRNPFAPAPLTDDEIAIAECLVRMDACVETGADFYSLAEASQDHYLNLLAQEALDTGETVRAQQQPWAG
jgi:hypothetical protein